MSHWAATVCIQLPRLLTNWAVHIAVNSRCRNGAQAEPALVAAGLTAVIPVRMAEWSWA